MDNLMDHTFLINSALLFMVMFVFNFIGATTGGSAIITIPVCIFFGLAPAEAVATTRFGVLGSSLASLYGFKGKDKVNYTIGIIGAIFAGVGAIMGAFFIASLSPVVLQRLLGCVMLLMIGLSIWRKRIKQALSMESSSPSKIRKWVGYISLSVVGFLSGSFGGQGVLLNYVLTSAFKQPFLEAAGTRTIINFFVAIVAVFIYQKSGIVNWRYAAVVLAAMILGKYFGVLYAFKKGEKWVENVFTLFAFLMALKLII
jgi:uncharacterized protein